jgi:hypothetical protein
MHHMAAATSSVRSEFCEEGEARPLTCFFFFSFFFVCFSVRVPWAFFSAAPWSAADFVIVEAGEHHSTVQGFDEDGAEDGAPKKMRNRHLRTAYDVSAPTSRLAPLVGEDGVHIQQPTGVVDSNMETMVDLVSVVGIVEARPDTDRDVAAWLLQVASSVGNGLPFPSAPAHLTTGQLLKWALEFRQTNELAFHVLVRLASVVVQAERGSLQCLLRVVIFADFFFFFFFFF